VGEVYDVELSRALRDEGMARVLESEAEFAEQFAALIRALPSGWIGQCEDIRRVWPGIDPKPQAWGANWNAAVKRGELVELRTKVPMTASKSHGRRTHLHRKV
jgi:hypothetical protein